MRTPRTRTYSHLVAEAELLIPPDAHTPSFPHIIELREKSSPLPGKHSWSPSYSEKVSAMLAS